MIEWLKALFRGRRYTVTVSYDTKYGNSDDKVYTNVRKISKQTWKELKFITEDKKVVDIRSNSGLHYRIEEQ